MRNLTFLLPLFVMACSFNDETSRLNRGTLTLEVEVLDSAGREIATEEDFKNQLSATLYRADDEAIQSWENVNQLPASIRLPLGSYYLVVESRESVASQRNTITHYAQTDLVHITNESTQGITLTLQNFITPAAAEGFFSSTPLSEDAIF